MTEREKFELWAESQGWFPIRLSNGEYLSPHLQDCYEAWLAAKQQAHCEALSDLHKLEQVLTEDDPTASV